VEVPTLVLLVAGKMVALVPESLPSIHKLVRCAPMSSPAPTTVVLALSSLEWLVPDLPPPIHNLVRPASTAGPPTFAP